VIRLLPGGKMAKLKFVIMMIIMTQFVMAEVPTMAFTFDTDITIYNATNSQTDKIREAEDLIKEVISTEEFRTAVLNHTYNGVKKFVDNGGYSNSQIYTKILEGAERLNGNKNNSMDMGIKTYYESSSTVGFTSTAYSYINMNTKFLNSYTPAQVTRNMTHEWLHKLGFHHAVSYSYSRDYSVPYGVGSIMERIAKKIVAGTVKPGDSGSGSTILTAPTNVTLSSTSSSVTLKWSAASGAVSYKVYRQLEGDSTIYLQGTTSSLSYTQSSPTKKATYYVRSVDKNGNTLKSSTVTFSASVSLGAPKNLSLSWTSSKLTLKWNAATGAKSYKVYRRIYGTTTNYLQTTTTSLSFSQSTPSKSAYYYVRCIDSSGNTMKSSEIKFTK
jgi:hypothetical protein